jgi:hypothetical protein
MRHFNARLPLLGVSISLAVIPPIGRRSGIRSCQLKSAMRGRAAM